MAPKEQVCNYPELGEVAYKRNYRARRLSIRIKRTGEVKITIPGTLPFATAEDFVLSKSEWITEKVQEIKGKGEYTIMDGFATKEHTLHYKACNQSKIRILYNRPRIEILHPSETSIDHSAVQIVAKKAIELAYRIEAKEYLPQRLQYLAQAMSFKYSKVTIRNTVSRWGSCSAKNSISLSLHLMKLPPELIDYVLLHELCHTEQKNHGPKFWELLNQKTEGRAKQLAKEVKNYSTRI
ncbi:MAG: M48 family metallopeptidase [Bacteroidales bacterium]|nr:M48 family metallopeptidase [Bacteroidales bacterium]